MQSVIIIPARYASVRFPGKALVELNGKTLIQRCYESACQVPGIAAVYVATDDERISSHVKNFNGKVVMTPESCANGTERCAAALDGISETPEIVINWQGDSPLIEPQYVSALIAALSKSSAAELVTPVIKCDATLFQNLLRDRKAGRVGGTVAVLSNNRRALYFSKELIPYSDKITDISQAAFYYHIGMYGYRPAVLRQYPTWSVGPLEKIEGLEQLRFLENNRHVEAVPVPGRGHWEVNNPEDVPLVEKLLREHGRD